MKILDQFLFAVSLNIASLVKLLFPAWLMFKHECFTGALMKNVDLASSHMAGVNLRVATLKNANLQNCDLRGAVLAGADLEVRLISENQVSLISIFAWLQLLLFLWKIVVEKLWDTEQLCNILDF